MHILLVFGEGETIDARGAPGIDVTIDIDHLRVVGAKIVHRALIEV